MVQAFGSSAGVTAGEVTAPYGSDDPGLAPGESMRVRLAAARVAVEAVSDLWSLACFLTRSALPAGRGLPFPYVWRLLAQPRRQRCVAGGSVAVLAAWSPDQSSSSSCAVKGGQASNFSLPVDAEHKATVSAFISRSLGFSQLRTDRPRPCPRSLPVRLWSFARPHMSAFHLAWIAFFVSFCSTFMAAPLMVRVSVPTWISCSHALTIARRARSFLAANHP